MVASQHASSETWGRIVQKWYKIRRRCQGIGAAFLWCDQEDFGWGMC